MLAPLLLLGLWPAAVSDLTHVWWANTDKRRCEIDEVPFFVPKTEREAQIARSCNLFISSNERDSHGKVDKPSPECHKRSLELLWTPNVTVFEETLNATSVLLLGNSIDRNTLEFACVASGHHVLQDPVLHDYQFGASSCRFGGLRVAWALQFGVGPPPYWRVPAHVAGSKSSEQFVKHDLVNFARRALPQAPAVVVVDSSTWDLANLWKRDGMLDNWTLPDHALRDWCDHLLPELLNWTSTAFPTSRVAFRTATTMVRAEPGRSPAMMEALTECARQTLPAQDYSVIDFHGLVDAMMEEGAEQLTVFPSAMRTLPTATHGGLRKQNLHPGAGPSMRYLSLLFNFVRSVIRGPEGGHEGGAPSHEYEYESSTSTTRAPRNRTHKTLAGRRLARAGHSVRPPSCLSHRQLNLTGYTFRTTECLWQTRAQLCPNCQPENAADKICVPIEPIPTRDWRGRRLGAVRAPVQGARLQSVLLKPGVTPLSQCGFGRHLYIDIGANTYSSSIGGWFRATYPYASAFSVVALEPAREHYATYQRVAGVELVQAAGWIQNTTMQFETKQHTKKGHGSGTLVTRNAAAAAATSGGRTPPGIVAVQAIDVADLLRRRATEEDYVVVKMDVEGAEYDIVPHLLASGVTHLIDEIFVEAHTNINRCCRPPNDVGRHFPDAMRLVASLRAAGVYAHAWS